MSKLNIDQSSIKKLFEDKKSDFLIPDYQRPYAWGEEECQTLWDDIFEFAFPDDNKDKFNKDEEYYLGPIVTFKNSDNKKEIIDGQQRLTTLMLLLRAFYSKFSNMKDENSIQTRETIARCIWKTDEFGKPDLNALKIDSEVATDNDKDEFLKILRTGDAVGLKSRYAENFRFFEKKINEFLLGYSSYFPYLPIRILNNCILLPIEAEDQNTALRIFSTLNDRGKPLSDADIFKAQFYKYFTELGKKKYVIDKWKKLEDLCEKMFNPQSGTPLDELFTRYMYFERAKLGIKTSTTEALRKFYEKNKYAILKSEGTFNNLIDLANFWKDVYNQNEDRFSNEILKKLFVLYYAPNGMWTYIVSVYYLQNRDNNGLLKEYEFSDFLSKIIAFIWAYAIYMPGVNALRTPIFNEMNNIVLGKKVEFGDNKFDLQQLKNMFTNYEFNNNRPITKSMLAWWAFQDRDQNLISLEKGFEIEHIYPKNRYEKEKSLTDKRNLEKLGNKSLLEKKINIRASDYRFADKIKYYEGFESRGKIKEGTEIISLKKLANRTDFVEDDIIERNEMIINTFMDYLKENNLEK